MSKLFTKRTFIVVSPTARTSPDFPLKGIAGSTGRLDVIARSILTILQLDENIRKSIVFKALLMGPPNPPIVLEVYGSLVRGIYENEIKVIEAIRKVLAGEHVEGFSIEKVSLKKLLENLLNTHERVYYLHENGEEILRSIKPAKTIAFILGSHVDIPTEYEVIIDKMNIPRVSLGSISYLTSQCIIIVNWLLDNYGKHLWRLP